MFRVLMYLIVFVVVNSVNGRIFDKRKCPEVRAVPHFDLSQVSYNTQIIITIFYNYFTKLFIREYLLCNKK